MKKLTAILLTAILVLSVSITVLADGTTTLTTTVPAATYTLNIPADQEITFASTSKNIGNVTVTDSTGFGLGKDLQVTVTYDAFSSDSVSTTIPYTLGKYSKNQSGGGAVVGSLVSGNHLTFKGQSNGTVTEQAQFTVESETRSMTFLEITIKSEDWGKALAGEYSTTITFTSEVVSSGN